MLIDPAASEAPVVKAGDTLTFTFTAVDGVMIPDGMTDEGELCIFVELSPDA